MVSTRVVPVPAQGKGVTTQPWCAAVCVHNTLKSRLYSNISAQVVCVIKNAAN